jgi:hypothetical protein
MAVDAVDYRRWAAHEVRGGRMQPCGVCGGVGVDAAGYCTQCRTYRGQPGSEAYPAAHEPNSPASGAPYSGSPYGAPYGQSSGAPYSGTPYGQSSGTPYGQSSGAPYGAVSSGPSYPPPAYPTAGQASYPPPQPPQPPRRTRNSFAIPLIALSITLVVLVIAIVAVVVIRSGTKKSPVADPTPAAAVVDECVVGAWHVTSHTEDLALDTGKVKFTGSGAKVTLNADGTGVTDFGQETTFTATVNGLPVKLVVTGTITYDFRTNNNTVSFSNVKADGTATVTISETGFTTSTPLTGDDSPAKYTCSNEKLTQQTELAVIEMARA